MTPTDVQRIRRLLEACEDPALLAFVRDAITAQLAGHLWTAGQAWSCAEEAAQEHIEAKRLS